MNSSILLSALAINSFEFKSFSYLLLLVSLQQGQFNIFIALDNSKGKDYFISFLLCSQYIDLGTSKASITCNSSVL